MSGDDPTRRATSEPFMDAARRAVHAYHQAIEDAIEDTDKPVVSTTGPIQERVNGNIKLVGAVLHEEVEIGQKVSDVDHTRVSVIIHVGDNFEGYD